MLSNTETNERYPYHLEMQNIRGKSIVIVGDASSAGRATAMMLAELGAKVFVSAQNADELNALLSDLTLAGGRAEGIVVALCRPESVRRFFEEAERRLGRIDVVVNFMAAGDDLPVDPEACQNLSMEQAIMHMQVYGKGHIINLSGRSTERASLIPVTGKVSARGVAAALRHQANELGLRVTLIESGFADEELSAGDIARCVYSSLIEPSGGDVIFLNGRFPAHTL